MPSTNEKANAIHRPAIKVGTSLSSLNLRKQVYGTSSQVLTNKKNQKVFHTAEESGSGSEEESDDDTSSGDDDEDNEPAKSLPIEVAHKPSPPTSSDDSDDSDSDESGESNGGENDGMRAAQEDLARAIARVASGDSQIIVPSPKAYRTSTQPGGKKVKKVGKYVTGQKFRMVS